MGVLAAERIKLTSVKSPWWCSGIVVVLGLGLAALFAGTTRSTYENMSNQGMPTQPPMTAFEATIGVQQIGVMVLMVLSALVVTSEYRFGVIRNTFMASNNRTAVMLAKAGIAALWSAVLTTVLAAAAIILARVIAGPEVGANLTFSNGDTLRVLYTVPIYAALAAILAVGIGALVRQTAGAVTILLLWPLLLENIASVLPKIGEHISPFLPFLNASYFLAGDNGISAGPMMDFFHWGPWAAIVYFGLVAGGIFGLSVIVVNKRDA
ncbi:ABC transporter permease [Lolliginicoccus suaedae]|uniref:ABC transporter permease n=1 Tax=Lolliginicoccus suaedae TaxID=2605429 RepID=UPI0011ED7564|nr:ABC transporter permease [Lolliginicoccus suaedae]